VAAFFVTGMDIGTFYKTYFKPGKVSTDSRTIQEGDVFIALRGENFNGNEYAGNALESGASIAVIDDPAFSGLPKTWFVEDSMVFLQSLALQHRHECRAHFLGLTGTNGKTTTKELIHTVLSEKFKCQATRGNLNNHIGVPLTLLSVEYETEIAIVEMGANHIGEIEQLCNICLPDSGLITNIGKAHLEGFGSLEGVKKAKGELYNFLMDHHRKIYVNDRDEMLRQMLKGYDNVLSYHKDSGCCSGKISGSSDTLIIELSRKGEQIEVHTHMTGNYNLQNILAAACIGFDFGLDLEMIKKGLEKYYPSNQRSQLLTHGSLKLLLDCYNANPTSMKESIESFMKIPSKKKMLILGGMKELGPYSVKEHVELGAYIGNLPIDYIFLIGPEFNPVIIARAVHLDQAPEIEDYLAEINLEDMAILVKGSRANKLERIKEFIMPDLSESLTAQQ